MILLEAQTLQAGHMRPAGRVFENPGLVEQNSIEWAVSHNFVYNLNFKGLGSNPHNIKSFMPWKC